MLPFISEDVQTRGVDMARAQKAMSDLGFDTAQITSVTFSPDRVVVTGFLSDPPAPATVTVTAELLYARDA